MSRTNFPPINDCRHFRFVIETAMVERVLHDIPHTDGWASTLQHFAASGHRQEIALSGVFDFNLLFGMCHYINFHIRFKKNTLQYRNISAPPPDSSVRTAAVNAAPPIIHNHASSSLSPRSSINHFSLFISLITGIIVSQFGLNVKYKNQSFSTHNRSRRSPRHQLTQPLQQLRTFP